MYETVKLKLQKFPEFRERKNRIKYLCILAMRHCGLESKFKAGEGLTSDQDLSEFAIAYTSYDRAWRKVLQKNPDLRGTDFDDKQILEEEKMLELGYSPNYYKDVEQLKLL